ncbi:kunitz-type protease inhibitor 2 [Stigmatopora argus]
MTRSTLRCALWVLFVSFVVSVAQTSQNESSNGNCSLPMEVGPCRAAFPRFYYHTVNETCLEFTYGGCQGNGNSFATREECQSTCGQVTDADASTALLQPRALNSDQVMEDEEVSTISAEEFSELCQAAPTTGPCKASFRSWYYDDQERRCKEFVFGGCKGNRNNYPSQESCLQTCHHVNIVRNDWGIYQSEPSTVVTEEQCLSTPDPGPCRAAFPKFYYHAESDSCRSFVYGGCHGNQNRYNSEEDCLNQCSGFADGFFAGRDKTRSRWTAGFFVLLTLAAVCTALVSALVVTMLRRVHLSRRGSVVSDKEELLPDLHSSLESLSSCKLAIVDKA